MSRRTRSAAFYVETAITLFFLLCTAAVIAQLFSTALQSSHLAEEMTRAEFAAEDEAQSLRWPSSPNGFVHCPERIPLLLSQTDWPRFLPHLWVKCIPV